MPRQLIAPESTKGYGGIYRIFHEESGKEYIGQTTSLGRRACAHEVKLRKNEHHCRHLQRAWKKHGPEGFRYEAILICAKEHMNFYEQIFMDAAADRLFNTSKVGGSAMNDPRLQKKILKSMNEGKLFKLMNQSVQKYCTYLEVLCVELGLIFEDTFEAAKFAQENTSAHVHVMRITHACQEGSGRAYGYTWKFLEFQLDKFDNIIQSSIR